MRFLVDEEATARYFFNRAPDSAPGDETKVVGGHVKRSRCPGFRDDAAQASFPTGWAVSSAVERRVDIADATGSIPVLPTISFPASVPMADPALDPILRLRPDVAADARGPRGPAAPNRANHWDSTLLGIIVDKQQLSRHCLGRSAAAWMDTRHGSASVRVTIATGSPRVSLA